MSKQPLNTISDNLCSLAALLSAIKIAITKDNINITTLSIISQIILVVEKFNCGMSTWYKLGI